VTCALEPVRVCGPCELGHKQCAHRLMLDWKAEQQLQRLAWLIDGPGWIVPERKASVERERAKQIEPTVSGECRKCDQPFALFTYLAEFLQLHGAMWPLCEDCR
jgi:hypothetical protein